MPPSAPRRPRSGVVASALAVAAAPLSLSDLSTSFSLETRVTSPGLTPIALASLITLARARVEALGLARGARLAIWRAPTHVALALPFAAAAAGVVPVWLNDRWSVGEAVAALGDARASVVFAGEEAGKHISEALREAGGTVAATLVVAGEGWTVLSGSIQRVVLEDLGRDYPGRREGGRDEALPGGVFYTSGTTGQPKGVVLSATALLCQARAKLTHVGFSSATRYIQLAPLFHLGGASSAIAVAMCGGVIVVPQRGDTTPAAWLDTIEAERVNTLVVVPSVLQMMVDAHGRRGASAPQGLRSVKTILYGGGACSRSLRADVSGRVFLACERLVGAYGMTETASSMTFIDHCGEKARSRRHGSAGRSPEHVELEVRRVGESFRTRAGGWLVGEIFTRGPHVMDGYFNREEETEAVLGRDGWLATGDLGYADGDGYLFIVGRMKDMIKTGGENVFAGEVEAVLGRHPSVISSAVVGVPHRVLGEAVVAAVIVSGADGGNGGADSSLDAWCRHRLSPYKRPKWFVAMDRFPSNPTGKVLKSALRSEVERLLHLDDKARPKL